MSGRSSTNFAGGPSALPLEVLEGAREDLLQLAGERVGILELSHRSPRYAAIQEDAEERLRRLLGAPADEWSLLFLQGGASLQFAMVPMNLGPSGDYVLSGVWSQKALAEAERLGTPRVAASGEADGFNRLPREFDFSPAASYVHFTSNNTIHGTQWQELPSCGAPTVIDASSDVLTRPFDLRECGLLYAGAQKNLGPAGVTLVLVRHELLSRAGAQLPKILSYRTHAEAQARYNTPPVFAVSVVARLARWLEAQGGLEWAAAEAEHKASLLYELIDRHELYQGLAEPDSRSRVNVCFRLARPELEPALLAEAEERGLLGLKGHRSVGGLRASLYNAVSRQAAAALAAFLDDFAERRR